MENNCVEKYKARRDARLAERKFHNDYGVKGMKWGEHKTKEETESTAGIAKLSPNEQERYIKHLENMSEKIKGSYGSTADPGKVGYREGSELTILENERALRDAKAGLDPYDRSEADEKRKEKFFASKGFVKDKFGQYKKDWDRYNKEHNL